MAKLADMLDLAQQTARPNRKFSLTLKNGLAIVFDFRDPARQQILFCRRNAWPSSTEISTCRRTVDIPPGADTERLTKGEWNAVAYSWPVAGPQNP